MKILPITPVAIKQDYLNKQNVASPVSNFTEQTGSNGVSFAYRDFNINFTGRTPEDFYAQDFNRENMPRTMKDYLDYNYEERQHIPPEQMMKEVFKFIEIADSLEDVKNMYPHEDLFKNLHENSIKSRKGILSEIRVARELSDAPLLKNGSDDFGMYLLKKIYLEGKTLKEISKDFLEKDINDEYKGFITEPIQYSTLSAYGIEYPKLPFWKSFIATREEYKKFFVTLPKNEYIPGVNAGSKTSSPHSGSKIQHSEPTDNEPKPRRYNIKSHRKSEIVKDIIDKKPEDIETIKKTVVKRFGKNDPEASFIVKYMSPIMTVAAERIHLSEEMRLFSENESINGKTSSSKSMFGRFWKQNPEILKHYSYAITDTIEMFEDIYGAGGLIGINASLEPVKSNSVDKRIIDFVNPEFLDLLSYAQQIEPRRNEFYSTHDELQKQWEEHFLERYGSPDEPVGTKSPEDPEMSIENIEKIVNLPVDELLAMTAAQNNADVFTYVNEVGETVHLTLSIDELFNDELKSITRYMPTKYAQLFISELSKEGAVSDKLKLSIALKRAGLNIEDPRIYTGREFEDKYIEMELKPQRAHKKEEAAARTAIADTIASEIKSNVGPFVYKMNPCGYHHMINDFSNEAVVQFWRKLIECKPIIDKLYDEYRKPLSNSEVNKIGMQVMDSLLHYDRSQSTLEDEDTRTIMVMLKEMMQYKSRRDTLRSFFNSFLPEYPHSRSILNKNLQKENKQGKFEEIMEVMLYRYLNLADEHPHILTIFNRETYDRYKYQLSDPMRERFEDIISRMGFMERSAFEAKGDFLMEKSK